MDGKPSTPAIDGAAEAIGRLTQKDWNQLFRAAEVMCAGDSIAPDDLMSWVFAAYLDDRRTWRPDVASLTQLRNAMKSMISSMRKSRKRHPQVSLADFLLTEDLDADEVIGAPPLSPEEELAFEDRVKALIKLFADDTEAQEVLDALWAGMSPKDIQDGLGMDATTYASTRKRIRRKLNAHIESGAFNV